MTKFQVWAPHAQQMELQLGNARIPMRQGERGWWSVETEGAGPGCDYGYYINGEGPYPDPCSPYQPNGVHGLSRTVDQGAFQWTDQRFQAAPLSGTIIYELHIGTFTPQGTFDSAIERLGYLRNLGITYVELLPVAEFPGDYGWGYDGVDLYAPHHSYGGPDGLKRLVNACHEHGIAVMLDVVYNHLGPDGNYLDKFGPYHNDRYQTAWGDAMNLDGPGSDEVRRFFLDNARMWLRDYHMDGLRLDAVHALFDNTAMHFLEEIAREVDTLGSEMGRHLEVIGESDLNDPRLVRSIELGGFGLNAVWSDDFHHALHVTLTGEQAGYYQDFTAWEDLAKALTHVYVYDGNFSSLRSRRHGRPVGDLPSRRFLGYIQNHDQVGNRTRGERINQLVGMDLARVAAAVVLAAPYVPMLFMGEEWGASTPFQYFTNHEGELGRLVSEGRRGEFALFGWRPEDVPDPQDFETFRRSKLNWDELDQEPHASMLDWYRRLIELRYRSPVLTDGHHSKVHVEYDPEAEWFLFTRGNITVVCNFAENEQEVLFDHGEPQEVIASNPGARLTESGVFLPPQSVAIVEK